MESINGDTFVDVLDDRRKTQDFFWANKPWEMPVCRYSKFRSPSEIKKAVLRSYRVKNAIKEVINLNMLNMFFLVFCKIFLLSKYF